MDPKDLEFEETLADSELLLKNTARSIDDDAEYPITAGMCHYCPEGHTHNIVNTGDTELKLLGVLPIVK